MATSSGRRHDPREFMDVLAAIDLHPALPHECHVARAIAAELIGPQVAPPETFEGAHAHTGCSVFVSRHDGEVTGVLGLLPLVPAGLHAVETHTFKSRNPPLELLCAPGDPFPGLYGWGFAARGRKASALVVMGAIKIREHLSDIPFFTRAATPAGVKVICGRMGYAPFPGAPDDLLWNPVDKSQERAA
jgi:hypothetical protein